MASVEALLAALDERCRELAAQPLAPEAAMLGWHRIARHAIRVLATIGPPPDLMPILQRIVSDLERRDAPGNSPITAIGYTLGVLADTIDSHPDIVQAAGTAARGQLRTCMLGALHQVATLTLTTMPTDPTFPSRTLIRELAEVTEAAAYVPWRGPHEPLGRLSLGPIPGSLDQSSARWAESAIDVLTSRTRVTSYAFQRTAVTIARICHAAATVYANPVRQQRVDHALTAALARAHQAWQAAADWPPEVRLGGRTPDLRQRSADLDEALAALRLVPASEIRAPLLSAKKVAACYTTALAKVVDGRSLWISVQALGPTYLAHHPGVGRTNWVPDPYSGTAYGATLVGAAVQANLALREAVDHIDRPARAVSAPAAQHGPSRWEATNAADRSLRQSAQRAATRRARSIGR